MQEIYAAESNQTSSLLSLNTCSSVATPKANEAFWITLKMQLPPLWHAYAPPEASNKNNAFVKTPKISFTLPKGMKVLKVKWEPAKRLKEKDLDDNALYGYENDFRVFIHIGCDHDLKYDHSTRLLIHLTVPICHNICKLETHTLTHEFSKKTLCDTKDIQSLPVEDEQNLISFLFILLTAFFAGLLLNMMPCVFPILALKIYDLSSLKGENLSRKQIGPQVWGYTVGILVSMFVLSSTLYILRLSGQYLGWGFQLQSPFIISLLSLVFLALMLNMFGLFDMGQRFAGYASSLQLHQKRGLFLKSAFNGLLACVVSTPCSAPFMGSAIAFAITQPFEIYTLVFLMLGLGLSFPYVIFYGYPKLCFYLPKSGPWMIVVKQIMGFAFLGTVLWLTWIIAHQSIDYFVFYLMSIWGISIALWFYGQTTYTYVVGVKKIIYNSVILIICLGSLGILYHFSLETSVVPMQNKFKAYDEELVKEDLLNNKPVLINFTAKWCLTCQLNKNKVFHTQEFKDLSQKYHLNLYEADWTTNDDRITKLLQTYNHLSIPLLVYYPKNAKKYYSFESIVSLKELKALLETKG